MEKNYRRVRFSLARARRAVYFAKSIIIGNYIQAPRSPRLSQSLRAQLRFVTLNARCIREDRFIDGHLRVVLGLV